MRNVFIVLKHEIVTTLHSISFWVMTFLFPGLIILLTMGSQVVTQNSIQQSQSGGAGTGGSGAAQRYSYVDEAGLIKKIPEGIPASSLQAYPSVTEAQRALEAGEIEWYAILPSDMLQTRNLSVVQRTFNPMGQTPENFFQYLVAYNLAGNPDAAPLLSVQIPGQVQHDLAPVATGTESPTQQSGPGTLVAYGSLFLFFMLISMSSSMMLRSVSKEKSSRVAEVLLLSLRPVELMVGKLAGLSVVALLQMVAWVGGVMLFLKQGQDMISGLAQINLPPGFLLWAVVYCLLGYLLYASLMGAISALAPDLRESGQFTFALLLPLMIPLFLNPVFADAPNSTAPVILSLFPLTAPTSMLTRLASGPVPIWQSLASLAALGVTTVLVVLLAARFFRPETLLSSAALKWPQLFAELRHAIKG